MDVIMVARSHFVLIGLVLLAAALLLLPGATGAQETCPPWTNEIGVPGGTWPSVTKACEDQDQAGYIVVSNQVDHPCDQQWFFHNLLYGAFEQRKPVLYLVPPAPYNLTNRIRIRFFIYEEPIDFGASLPQDATVYLKFYDASGILRGGKSVHLNTSSDVTIINAVIHDFMPLHYDVYSVDTVLDVGGQGYPGGYITFMHDPGALLNAYFVTSVQYAPYGSELPMSCEVLQAGTPVPVPTSQLPATYTPAPTITVGAGTPTYAAPTAAGTAWPTSTFPTAAAGTSVPTRTPAPVIFSTIPAERTPTPWPAYNLPPINFPTIPTAMSMTIDDGGGGGGGGELPPVPTIQPGDNSEMETRISGISSAWADQVEFSRLAMDTAITDTTGIAAPSAIVPVLTQDLGKPISYVKTLGVYMPNAAIHIGAIILMAAWIVFNIIAKPMLGIVKTILEIIRRLWEAIPLN